MPARWSIVALALGVLVVLARPAVAQAAPEVQGAIGSIGVVGPSASVLTTAPVPAGGSIIVVASASNIGGNTPTCGDSVNGPYTVERTDGNFGSSAVIAVCARHNVSSTPAGTSITVTWPGATVATQNQIIAIAARGLEAAPLDRSTGTGPSVQNGSSLTTGSVSTTTSASELLVGGFYVARTVPLAGFTAGDNGTASACATSGTPTYTALPGVGATTFSLWVETCIVDAPLRLDRAGRVRVTLLGARSSWCDGDLLHLTPALTPTPAPGTADGTLPTGARRLWSSYLRHVGASVELGPYPAGTTLVLGLSPRGVCAPAGGVPRTSGGAFARVTPGAAPGLWDVWWEDFRMEGADYDDLVLRVEVLPSGP